MVGFVFHFCSKNGARRQTEGQSDSKVCREPMEDTGHFSTAVAKHTRAYKSSTYTVADTSICLFLVAGHFYIVV